MLRDKKLIVGAMIIGLALAVVHSMRAEEVTIPGKGKYLRPFEYYIGNGGLVGSATDNQAFASLNANLAVPPNRRVVITDVVVSGSGTLGVGGDPPKGVLIRRIDVNEQLKDVAVFQTASALTVSHSYSSGITFEAGEKIQLESLGPPSGSAIVELRGIVLKVK